MDAGFKHPIIIKTPTLTNEAIALAAEIDFIAPIGRLVNKSGILTNLAEGGFGHSGCEMSDEAKDKVSRANSERAQSTAERKMRSKAMKGVAKGIPKSEAHRLALSAANTGKKFSPERCVQHGLLRKGIPWSAKRRAATAGKEWSPAKRAAYEARYKKRP